MQLSFREQSHHKCSTSVSTMASMHSRSYSTNYYSKNDYKSVQIKKEALIALEEALKKRVTELRELCLKEGELTGHLPVDYPLQPREPIPQVRRRRNYSHNNIDKPRREAPLSTNFSAIQTSTDAGKPVVEEKLSQDNNFNVHGAGNYLPYYEETKPFQMSDFYKYSSKLRNKYPEYRPASTKTTRQLQEDVAKRAALIPSCDEHIQNSVKLIEKSSQKLIEATARAISGNPGLAEKLNNILPKN